jgi:hypothetical protein
LGVDAAVAVLAAIGLVLALGQGEDWLMSHLPAQALYSIAVSNDIASAAPAVAAVGGAVRTVLISAAALVLLAIVIRRAPRPWMLPVLALILLLVNVDSSVRTVGEFALSYGIGLLWGVGALLFCVVFARRNYVAYLLVFWILALRPAASELMATGNPGLQANGAAVIAVMIASYFWTAAVGLRAHFRGSD